MSKHTEDGERDPFVSPWGTEKYIVTIGEDHKGRRTATRSFCHLDLTVATTGKWEKASDRVIADALKDLIHELHRRAGTLGELGRWGAPRRTVRNRGDEHEPPGVPELDAPPPDLDDHEGALDV